MKLVLAIIACIAYTEAVKCKGGGECPSRNTCCTLPSGQEGCCPLPNAACCADHLHCCPEGYTCDTPQGTCNKKVTKSIPLIERRAPHPFESVVPKEQSITCPDGNTCPDSDTCCNATTVVQSQFGCCPMSNAVCCNDNKHCCPNGYSCVMSNSSYGECVNQGVESIPMVAKTVALVPVNSPFASLCSSSVICPDGASKCPSGETCCKLSDGQWGCCPMPNADCCADHIHCCPHGYQCNTAAGTCNKQGITFPMASKHPAQKVLGAVICPDKASECPTGNTCCMLSTGEYGCCPFPKADCCSDHLHCCPSGYSCDVSKGTCNKQGIILPMAVKSQSKKIVNAVMCPDGRSECPDGNTCCKLASGQYGCCPAPNAVCCNDHLHCCPHGYTCSASSGTCNKQGATLPMLAKSEAKKVSQPVICPDGRSECPNGNTCCKLASGQYGCCPAPNAVCCNDHLHCCPHGYTCSASSGTCNKQGATLPMLAKTEAKKVSQPVICPGGQEECPAGNTCCKLSSGQWGCCPLPNADCCPDHLHCCPHGYTCDISTGACNRQGISFPMVAKTAAKPVKETKNVVCPDQTSQCPDRNTCCKMSSGEYGCCPLPNADCCSDHVHCCPHGYTCNTGAGTCIQKVEHPLIALIQK